MGLREKAKEYRIKSKIYKPEKDSIEIADFITELLGVSDIESQIKTAIIGLISKFKTAKILINFIDEDENIYKCIGAKGISDDEKEKFNFEHNNYFIKALNKVVNIKDLIIEPQYREEINKFLLYNFKIIFPLNYDSDLKGFVTLGEKLDNTEYNENDFLEMQKFGKILGAVFYNSIFLNKITKKYYEIKDENRNLLTLFEGFKNINLSENLDEALSIFYRIVNDIYKVEVANFLIKDKDSNIYKVRKSWGMSEETNNTFFISQEDEIVKNIIEIGEAMLIPEFSKIDIFERISDRDKDKIKMFYLIPIKIGENCFGIMNIFNIKDINDKIPLDIERVLSFLPYSLLPYILYEKYS